MVHYHRLAPAAERCYNWIWATRTPPESDTTQLERRNRELSILNTIAEALNRAVDLDRRCSAALAQVAELLDLHTGWIWLLDEETGEPYLAAAQNLPPGLANAPARMEGTLLLPRHVPRRRPRTARPTSTSSPVPGCKALVDGTDGLRYHASIPLYAHGKKLGVLNVASPDWRELSADDLRLLYTVGDLLGIAIERARLFARSSADLARWRSATGWRARSTTRWRRGWPPSRCSWRPPTRCWKPGRGAERAPPGACNRRWP